MKRETKGSKSPPRSNMCLCAETDRGKDVYGTVTGNSSVRGLPLVDCTADPSFKFGRPTLAYMLGMISKHGPCITIECIIDFVSFLTLAKNIICFIHF